MATARCCPPQSWPGAAHRHSALIVPSRLPPRSVRALPACHEMNVPGITPQRVTLGSRVEQVTHVFAVGAGSRELAAQIRRFAARR